jgi:hypothetical protein
VCATISKTLFDADRKLLPLQLTADVNSASISEVRVISVPVDHYLSSADIKKLQSPMTVEAQPIEHAPRPEQHEEPAPCEAPPQVIAVPAREAPPAEVRSVSGTARSAGPYHIFL